MGILGLVLLVLLILLLIVYVVRSTPTPYDWSRAPSKGEIPPQKEEYGESSYLGGNDGYVP